MFKRLFFCVSLVALMIAGWSWGCGTPPPAGENPANENTTTDANQEPSTPDTSTPQDTSTNPDKSTPQDTAPQDSGPKDTAPGDTPPADTAPGPPKTIDQLTDGWNMIRPPKESGAVCSRGSEYAFFVHPGKTNKIVIDFEGGGACWDAASCSLADSLFKDSIDNLKKLFDTGYDVGIYDRKNEKNPVKDWHHVFVPYCTGDIHWGDNVATYTPKTGQPFEIRHKGAVNVRAVLDWVYKNVKDPEKIFVTGCSAGAYGSIMWAAHLAKQYQNAKLYQMGDSGVGVITDNFLKNSFPSWNAEQAAPSWIPSLDPSKVKIAENDLAYMYNEIANFYPNLLFSQYNTAYDKTQVFFFQAMGGGTSAQEWSDRMRALIKKISDGSKNFRSYIAAGEKHCIIPYKEFYEYEVNGVKLVDWVQQMLDGKDLTSQACEGDACKP